MPVVVPRTGTDLRRQCDACTGGGGCGDFQFRADPFLVEIRDRADDRNDTFRRRRAIIGGRSVPCCRLRSPAVYQKAGHSHEPQLVFRPLLMSELRVAGELADAPLAAVDDAIALLLEPEAGGAGGDAPNRCLTDRVRGVPGVCPDTTACPRSRLCLPSARRRCRTTHPTPTPVHSATLTMFLTSTTAIFQEVCKRYVNATLLGCRFAVRGRNSILTLPTRRHPQHAEFTPA